MSSFLLQGSTSETDCAEGNFCPNTQSQYPCEAGYFCGTRSTVSIHYIKHLFFISFDKYFSSWIPLSSRSWVHVTMVSIHYQGHHLVLLVNQVCTFKKLLHKFLLILSIFLTKKGFFCNHGIIYPCMSGFYSNSSSSTECIRCEEEVTV